MKCQMLEINTLSKKILNSNSFILTTHKNCDADGLGSILAFHHLFESQNKKVQSFVIDPIPSRYDFMNHQEKVRVYDSTNQKIQTADMALIFDTNDQKLIEPLYSILKNNVKEIVFIDHHQIKSLSSLSQYWVCEEAASTGELCYLLMEDMGVSLTREIALPIYISIIFDTHMFRSVKNLSRTFYTCSKLFRYIGKNHVYEQLFCQYDQHSWNQMLKVLNHVQYEYDHQIAFIEMNHQEFQKSKLDVFQLLDCLEMTMRQKSTQVGVLSVEEQPHQFKISFRSSSHLLNVAQLAGEFSGGGHSHSAGVKLNHWPKKEILQKIKQQLQK